MQIEISEGTYRKTPTRLLRKLTSMVISIASQKSGTGKTSTSISLSAGLAHKRRFSQFPSEPTRNRGTQAVRQRLRQEWRRSRSADWANPTAGIYGNRL